MAIIKVKDFNKSFNNKLVHQNVNFVVNEGECLGLLGGSGVGKSVILRSLIGLEKPDSGTIEIEGRDITVLNESQLFEVRKNIAYVFQNGALFDSMTVFENMAYPLRTHSSFSNQEIQSKVAETFSEFNLNGSEQLLPSELSGGMQKRVGLARAIILNPKIVLYDEPTAGLDPANTVTIQNLILKLKSRGTTSILVTHDMETALRVCDRICFLKNKEITELESIDDLRKNMKHLLDLFLIQPSEANL
ncbi:MAG: ATP-binding cassette domain-containing protein [Bdellovibrionales bacterium]